MATDAFLFLAIVCFALAGLAALLPVPCNHKERPGCPTCERDAIARRERQERSEHAWHSTSWGPTYRDPKCPYCRGNRE